MAVRRKQKTVVSFPSRDSRSKHQLQRERLIPAFTREHLEEVVAKELRDSATALRPLTVAFVELDDLPQLVETYGQQRGAKVDEGVSRILERNTRKNDTVGRYEAGRFVLILRETDVTAAALVCERIRSSVEKAVFAPQYGRVLRTSVAAGYATYTPEATFKKPQDLIQAAEDCLSEARQMAQDRIVGYPSEGTTRKLTSVEKNGSSG
jgi:diguanylate cyclase (GGDEF)-like protein